MSNTQVNNTRSYLDRIDALVKKLENPEPFVEQLRDVRAEANQLFDRIEAESHDIYFIVAGCRTAFLRDLAGIRTDDKSMRQSVRQSYSHTLRLAWLKIRKHLLDNGETPDQKEITLQPATTKPPAGKGPSPARESGIPRSDDRPPDRPPMAEFDLRLGAHERDGRTGNPQNGVPDANSAQEKPAELRARIVAAEDERDQAKRSLAEAHQQIGELQRSQQELSRTLQEQEATLLRIQAENQQLKVDLEKAQMVNQGWQLAQENALLDDLFAADPDAVAAAPATTPGDTHDVPALPLETICLLEEAAQRYEEWHRSAVKEMEAMRDTLRRSINLAGIDRGSPDEPKPIAGGEQADHVEP